eukprot:2192561-Rhodomonas_salina.1
MVLAELMYKMKDGLFIGNVAVVHDTSFLNQNKIGYCVKCQTGRIVRTRYAMSGADTGHAAHRLRDPRAPEAGKLLQLPPLALCFVQCPALTPGADGQH